MIYVEPGTIVVYSDVSCPWANLAVHRLWEARHALGLERAVAFDHRAFPLELMNERPTPKPTLDAEIAVVGARAPEAGWRVWSAAPSEWPVTTLLPMEAVQAAKQQSLAASAELDRALRTAFFRDQRCISLHHVILEVAAHCNGVELDALRDALETGTARHEVFQQFATAKTAAVKGSPHLFLPGGQSVHNPGITMHWEGEPGDGFPVIDDDDPSVIEALVRETGSDADRGMTAEDEAIG